MSQCRQKLRVIDAKGLWISKNNKTLVAFFLPIYVLHLQFERVVSFRTQSFADKIRTMKLQQQFEGVKLEPLKRSGRWFGGMRKEFHNRFRLYKSDFLDGFAFKCVTSVLYIFCVCLIPALTFGAILG